MRLDQKTASICLSVLSTTFGQLYDNYADKIFIEACAASAQLGLYKSKTNSFILNPDRESQNNLKKSLKKSQDKNVSTENPSRNLERLKKGIIEAWREPEEELTNDILPADQLTFSKLAKLLNVIAAS